MSLLPPFTTRTAEPFFSPACSSSSFTPYFFPHSSGLNEQRSSVDGKRGRLLFPECGAEALTSLMMFTAVLTRSGTEIGGKIMIVWRSGGGGRVCVGVGGESGERFLSESPCWKLASCQVAIQLTPPCCLPAAAPNPLRCQQPETPMIDILLHHNIGWCIGGI